MWIRIAQFFLLFWALIFSSTSLWPTTSIFTPPPTPTEKIPTRPSSLSLQNENLATTTASSTTKATHTSTTTPVTNSKVVVMQKEVVPANTASTPSPTPTITQNIPATPLLSFDPLNDSLRDSLVNILCTTRGGGSFKPITGSGVIIDKRGIILTNAHVAQYYLLRNLYGPGTVECVIRTGSPASNQYVADILYIPPKWIEENKGMIISDRPTGTGENDFALLYITARTNGEKLPTTFPAIAIDETNESLLPDDQLLLGGYPAGFLGGITVQRDLYILTTIGKVKKFYTFGSGTLDLIEISGSLAAQKGVSGGAAINQRNGKISGVITTTTDETQTGERSLRAISTSHIVRSFLSAEGKGIYSYLEEDPETVSKNFNATVAPKLVSQLKDVIEKRNQ